MSRGTSRRDFMLRVAGGSAALIASASGSGAQQRGRGGIHDSSIVRDSANLFAMDQSAAQSVQRPPKPGAPVVVSDAQRDELEHKIRCQCGCTLDVYTCRTTDFSCQVSPAMHRDVLGLVRGGYSAQEIIDAFVGTYGERVLMAPKKSGFNLLAWVTPGLAVVVGGFAVAAVLRRLGKEPEVSAPGVPPDLDATADELARLDAAVKGDDRGGDTR